MHIKSLDELVTFLKKSNQINELDQAGEDYKRAFEEDKEHYNLKPVQDKDDIKEEEEVKVDSEIEYETDNEPSEKNKQVQTPSLDSLIRNINDLRSGESLKRADVRNEVEEYFDGLTTDEQAVLVLFMRELAAVATKSKKGNEAQDPSDDPSNYSITGPKSTNKNKLANNQPVKKQVAKSTSSLEDDSAPIKVNESQDLTLIRKKFKLLAGD